MRAELAPETLVIFNQLTWLIALEDSINLDNMKASDLEFECLLNFVADIYCGYSTAFTSPPPPPYLLHHPYKMLAPVMLSASN
jgi:hypothetical protein